MNPLCIRCDNRVPKEDYDRDRMLCIFCIEDLEDE
jgi:hypothetical protein